MPFGVHRDPQRLMDVRMCRLTSTLDEAMRELSGSVDDAKSLWRVHPGCKVLAIAELGKPKRPGGRIYDQPRMHDLR